MTTSSAGVRLTATTVDAHTSTPQVPDLPAGPAVPVHTPLMACQIKMPKTGGRTSWRDLERARLDADVAKAVVFFHASLGDEWPGWTEGRPLANGFFTALQTGPAECVRLHRMVGVLDG